MKNDRPILFSAPMVQALLARTKTQTRRVVKITNRTPGLAMCLEPSFGEPRPRTAATLSPYGRPGDHLWVKETYFAYGRWETRFSEKKGRDEWHFVDMTLECGRRYVYAVEDDVAGLTLAGARHGGVTPGWWKRPAIFMPRAASRITLGLGDVRVERLQACSYEDAIAEGIPDPATIPDFPPVLERTETVEQYCRRKAWPQRQYRELWESINGAGSWEANPWVWVVEFKVTKP